MKIVEGPFLGMFKDSEFEQVTFKIDSGDRIFLFSDGLDFVFERYKIIKKYIEKLTILEFKKFIDEYLEDIILECGNLKDDCTLIAMEVK